MSGGKSGEPPKGIGDSHFEGKDCAQPGVEGPEVLREAIEKQRLDRLESSPIFAGTTLEELKEITCLVSEMTVGPGEEFINQDRPGDCFYVLVEGRALVFRRGDYDEEIPLAYVEPGESIGEMGYFAEGRRTASVRALEASQLLKISYQDLEKIFQVAPTLTRNFLALVTGRLRRTNLRFQDVAEKGLVAERSLESLRQFLDMSEIATLSQGIEGLIERVVITASKVMDADRATLFLLDDFAGELWSKVAEGMESREIRIPVGQGVAGWVARHDELLKIDDAYADERFNRSVDEKTGYRTRNILCGPVKNLHGQTVGVIQLINKKKGAFTGRDVALFKAFAYQTAIAVENFRLYRRLMTGHQKMAIMLDVATAVAQTLDLDALIIKIMNKTAEILDAERSSLFLLDEEKGELWSKVALGAEMTEIRFPRSVGLAGHVVDTGETLNILDAYRDPRFNPAVDRDTGFLTRTVLSMPVLNREGRIIGVTQAINKHAGPFDQTDEELLRAMSSQVAVALENAQLYRRTVNMKNYLAGVQDSITNAILTLDDDYRVVTA
ncbi:MAG: GAF domain-containing protein, partial [Thermodesulfobacteriota bacterium]